MIATQLAYLRERVRPALFGPVIVLLALAGCWVARMMLPWAGAYALGLTLLIVIQFRLWDDLADREHDRINHPDRVLSRSPLGPFRILLAMLAVAALLAASAGGLRPLLALAVLNAVFAGLYGFVRPRLNAVFWQYPVLLSKYPAIVGIVALAVGTPGPRRFALAALLVYAAALAYEAWHTRPAGAATATGSPTPEMFEPVRCYVCSGSQSEFLLEAEDDLTGRPGRFRFVRCTGCGLIYQSPRLTLEHVKSYYDSNYIAHQERRRWGPFAPAVEWALGSIDRAKQRIVARYVELGPTSAVLDVGCGAGTFLANLRATTGAAVSGVDFVDLSARPAMRGVKFHHGVFSAAMLGPDRFDLVTMWHFLEHDYDPGRSLRLAADALKPDGRLIVEVPRLDSLSARIFGNRWPGLQAPQHTAVYDEATLQESVRRAGLEIVAYLPYGAFPPYFYLFCGVSFWWRRGRGLDLSRAVVPYFAGLLLLLPVLPLLQRMNFAMQTVICRKARP